MPPPEFRCSPQYQGESLISGEWKVRGDASCKDLSRGISQSCKRAVCDNFCVAGSRRPLSVTLPGNVHDNIFLCQCEAGDGDGPSQGWCTPDANMFVATG